MNIIVNIVGHTTNEISTPKTLGANYLSTTLQNIGIKVASNDDISYKSCFFSHKQLVYLVEFCVLFFWRFQDCLQNFRHLGCNDHSKTRCIYLHETPLVVLSDDISFKSYLSFHKQLVYLVEILIL